MNKLSVSLYSRGPRCNADCQFCGWNRHFLPLPNENRRRLSTDELLISLDIMTQYIKQFDSWFYYYEREVWWCAVGVNIGIEIDGKNNDFERRQIGMISLDSFDQVQAGIIIGKCACCPGC